MVNDITEQDDIMTTEEVAKFMKLTPMTIKRYMKSRGLPFFKKEGAVRIQREKLLEWIESNTKSASDAL